MKKFEPLDDTVAGLIADIANTFANGEKQLMPDGRLELKVDSYQVQLVYKAMVMLDRINKEMTK